MILNYITQKGATIPTGASFKPLKIIVQIYISANF